MGAYGEARQQGGAEFGAGTCPSLVGAAWCDVAGHPTRRRPGGGEGARGRGKGLGPRAARADPPPRRGEHQHSSSRRIATRYHTASSAATQHHMPCQLLLMPTPHFSTVFSDALLALTCLELTNIQSHLRQSLQDPIPLPFSFSAAYSPLYLT